MSTLPDATASAALGAEVIKPVWFAFLDFDGDPLRANTSGSNITVSGSGDSDLDTHTFLGIDARLVTVSPVRVAEGGSDSVVAELSGIQGLDDDDLAMIADKTIYQGRDARLWRMIRNEANVQQGGFQAYYTGKMIALTHGGDDTEQKLRVTIESYLSAFSAPSNRSYLDQTRYDSGDLSAKAAIAIANGNFGQASTAPRANPGWAKWGGDPRLV